MYFSYSLVSLVFLTKTLTGMNPKMALVMVSLLNIVYTLFLQTQANSKIAAKQKLIVAIVNIIILLFLC